jgi:hypothetical protein
MPMVDDHQVVRTVGRGNVPDLLNVGRLWIMNPTRSLPRRALTSIAALSLSLGGAVGAFAALAGPAAADTTDVTNTADDGSGTSLRGVLETAVDGDVVVLTPGATYQLTICDPPAPAAAEGSSGWGDIEITGAVTIQGNGATIEQTCPDRVLYTQDEITLQDVTITGGDVEGPGGGLFEDSDAPITLVGVTFTGNRSSDGGGLAAFGDVSVSGSTFTENQAVGNGDGGGIKVFSAVGTTTIDGSTFAGNDAGGWGGAFEQEPMETDGQAVGDYNLTVTNSTISDNNADSDGGGGLDTEDDATITIDHSTLAGNSGGIGGAVGAFGSVTTFSANASTFSGNTAEEVGGAVSLSGEIADAAVGGTSADFVNSTITGNTEGAFGALTIGGLVSLNHVTMTENTSLGQSEEIKSDSHGVRSQSFDVDSANINAGSLSSVNSVVAAPHGAPNCSDFDAPTTDGGYNFSDDTSCGFTAPTSNVKTPNDPVLGALANNGGPTQTLLPLTGSPLLDAIPPAVCGANVDQRGVTRPQGSGCDIGAVEVEVVAPAPAAVVVTPKFTG